MQCKKCGKLIPDNSLLCTHCGASQLDGKKLLVKKEYLPPVICGVLMILFTFLSFVTVLPVSDSRETYGLFDVVKIQDYIVSFIKTFPQISTGLEVAGIVFLLQLVLAATTICFVIRFLLTLLIAKDDDEEKCVDSGFTASVISVITAIIPIATANIVSFYVIQKLNISSSNWILKLTVWPYLMLVAAIASLVFFILKKRKANMVIKKFKPSQSVLARAFAHRGFYLMFLPVFVFVILFQYLPMAGIRWAFFDYNAVGGAEGAVYVGLKHFLALFQKDQFWNAFWNTIELSVVKLLLNTFMAVIISLLLNEIVNLTAKKVVQTLIYLPHFMSWVVVASVFRLILSPSNEGLVNTFLMNIGVVDKGNFIYFLGDPKWWRPVFYIVNVWKDTGWSTILYLATLSSISPDLYEAAQIDGANRWNRMRFITLPSLANTIITVLILNLAKVMDLFESVFVMYNDAVRNVADVLQTYTYRQTFGSGLANFGYTTAVGLMRSIVGCALVLLCNYASKKVRGRGIV